MLMRPILRWGSDISLTDLGKKFSRDNLVRWQPEGKGGHVESFFLKANAPDPGRKLAFWLKLTIFAPRGGGPENTVAEVWGIFFEGATKQHVAVKEVHPIAAADLAFLGAPDAGDPRFAVGRSRFENGATRGEIEGAGGHGLKWDLRFEGDVEPLHLFPSEILYDGPFPKSKTLTPFPDVRFRGRLEVDGRAIEVAGWPGMQGHNWGKEHALRYAWAHCNAFRDERGDPVPDTFFEGVSSKVKLLGPLATPFLTLLYLRHRGRIYDLTGIRNWWNRSVAVGLDPYRWSFRAVAAADGTSLRGELEAGRDDMVGLYYRNPDGAVSHCLNSKIARCRIELVSARGEPIETLETADKAALEITVREPDHGVRMYV